MKFSIAAIFATAISAVCAQTSAPAAPAAPADAGIASTHPGLGEVLTAGQPYTIAWTVKDNNAKNINSIALMKGQSSNLEIYTANILSAPIPVNPPQYTWNIPATVETNPSYVLVFKGDNGQSTYSSYFTILGAAPGTANNNVTSSAATSAPAPNASNSAAASKSGSPAASSSAAGNSTSSDKSSSGASSLKAGIVGAGVAGAVALLF
ncbi:hypothetical protein RMATCC62417_18178 [Rhizopus microsporus]|nr:hypothetical protein RMATCC62417_18178 [Rhizopus microsporus]